MIKSMNILITGGAGFLGTNLSYSLLNEGHSITILDNLHSGVEANLSYLKQQHDFIFINHDIRHPISLDQKFDQIYHLACPASPRFYQADPIYTTETCVLGTLNALNKALSDNGRILFTSTSEIYGDPEVHPQSENYTGSVNCTGIRACYDEGKRCAESLMYDFHRMHGLDIKVARLFNTYGQFMRPDDGRVISNFICQSLLDQPITVYGDGKQTRSFCHVDDLIVGLKKMMNSSNEIFMPINLGNPNEFQLIELVQIIQKITNKNLKVEHLPLPQDDPKMRQPDITAAKNLLDWHPLISLDQGVEKTIMYFDELLSNS
jgi:UDP-glucuronate decarboxylase